MTRAVERTLEVEATAEETESIRKVVEATVFKASAWEPEVEGLTEFGGVLELLIIGFAGAGMSGSLDLEAEETVTTELVETGAIERALEAEAMAEDAETIRKVVEAEGLELAPMIEYCSSWVRFNE